MEQDGDQEHIQRGGAGCQLKAVHTQEYQRRIAPGPKFHTHMSRENVAHRARNMDVACSQERDKELCVAMPIMC